MEEKTKGALFVLSGIAVFGLMGIFVRKLNEIYGFSTLFLVFVSFFIPGIVMSVYFLFKDRSIFLIKGMFWFMVVFTIFDILNNFFYFQAFVNTTISNAVLTHYTMPIFVAVLAPFLLKEHLSRKTIYSLLIGILGLFFITSGNFSLQSKDFTGILYGTASGLMYALAVISIRHISKKLPIYSMRLYQTFLGSLILLPFIAKTPINYNFSFESALSLLVYAIVIGIVAILLHWNGIKRVTSHQAGILGYAEPLFATFFAFIFLAEIPALRAIIGGILIIASGYLVIK